MSVLIKGMKMPKSCIECPMQFGGMCYVQPPEIDQPRVFPTVDECNGRTDWCPLVEIPKPHGRLIDADALKADGWDLVKIASEEYNGKHRTYQISKEFDDIPTIIESETG